MPETTRPSLLLRLRDPHDLDAWSRFETTYGPLIVAYALARGVQFSDAEDVRQTVLLSFSRSAPGFSYDADRGRFRSYLGVCVRNAISRLDRRHTTVANGLDPETAHSMTSTSDTGEDDIWERQWMLHHYRLALRAVTQTASPSSVRVIEGLIAGRSTQHLAEELGMTPEAIRKVKQRMKEALARRIREQIDDEDNGPQPAPTARG